MQVDIHYYGTYVMARAAGLAPDDCRVIATSAQFVDDNTGKDSITFRDGARVDVAATAHHALDAASLEPEGQRNVWLPFHFRYWQEAAEAVDLFAGTGERIPKYDDGWNNGKQQLGDRR